MCSHVASPVYVSILPKLYTSVKGFVMKIIFQWRVKTQRTRGTKKTPGRPRKTKELWYKDNKGWNQVDLDSIHEVEVI